MDYTSIMEEAGKIFDERNPKYGDMQTGMGNVAQIAKIITGFPLTAHDVALILLAVKLSRLPIDRKNPDHYVDGINYFAFAGELVNAEDMQP